MKRQIAFVLSLFYLLNTTGICFCALGNSTPKSISIPLMHMTMSGSKKECSPKCGDKSHRKCCSEHCVSITQGQLNSTQETHFLTKAFCLTPILTGYSFRQLVYIGRLAFGEPFEPPPKTGRDLSILYCALRI